ncbi:PIN domain-containing protein [Mycolicibacter senuensis]|uniref:hypothetical protein n=1 Tax=Mycolicibacter senuensis TaxID=386913 RepID=UPI00158094E1|nr:hypothetical protein [Mycolicibacter senuensis]MDQ2625826.1 hypothetical protein [Actinomycetota bacterium]
MAARWRTAGCKQSCPTRRRVALIPRYLTDASAAARITEAQFADRLVPLIEAVLVATTAQLDAERSTPRNTAEDEQLWADGRLAYEYLPTNDEHWQTALDAQRALARQGRHRPVEAPSEYWSVNPLDHLGPGDQHVPT